MEGGETPSTMLEWLGSGDPEVQEIALNQLCMTLIMSDNVDHCLATLPPRTFIPALCKIFMESASPDNIIELAARALTYFSQASGECTKKIAQIEGAISAICAKLAAADVTAGRVSKDMAEQIVKLLEVICNRESREVYESGGVNAMLTIVGVHGLHKDTVHSAMAVVIKLCTIMDPSYPDLAECAERLGKLLEHHDVKVSELALRSFSALSEGFSRQNKDPSLLVTNNNLIQKLISMMEQGIGSQSLFIAISLLQNLVMGSGKITEELLKLETTYRGLRVILTSHEERIVVDGLRFTDKLLILLCKGRKTFMKPIDEVVEQVNLTVKNAIRNRDIVTLATCFESGQVEVDDEMAQMLIDWAASIGRINTGSPETEEDRQLAIQMQRDAQNILDNSAFISAMERITLRRAVELVEGPPELLPAELVHQSLLQLLPIYCEVFDHRNPQHRRTALAKIRECVEKITELQLAQNLKAGRVLRPNGLLRNADSVLGVVLTVLEETEDFDGQEQVLLILNTLMEMDSNLWVDQIQRLGVFEKIKELKKEPPPVLTNILKQINGEHVEEEATPPIQILTLSQIVDRMISGESPEFPLKLSSSGESSKGAELVSETPSPALSEEQPVEKPEQPDSEILSELREILNPADQKPEEFPDRKTLAEGVPYRWKEWFIVRGPISLFIWTDVMLIELPFGSESNGWFHYLADNEYQVMFSMGLVNLWDDEDPEFREQVKATLQEELREMLERWSVHRFMFAEDFRPLPEAILGVESSRHSANADVWELRCVEPNDLQIRYIPPEKEADPMTLTMKDETGGFVWQSGILPEKRIVVMPTQLLPVEFHSEWAKLGISKQKKQFWKEIRIQKIQNLAWKLWDGLKMEKLEEREEYRKILEALVSFRSATRYMQEEKMNSVRRNYQTGRYQTLKKAFFALLRILIDPNLISNYELAKSDAPIVLLEFFSKLAEHPNSYAAMLFQDFFGDEIAFSELVRLFVGVLEHLENLPQQLYDVPGGSSVGLQMLKRRILVKLEKVEGVKVELRDVMGRTVACDPLGLIGELRGNLHRVVGKQWYDAERAELNFVKRVLEHKAEGRALEFRYQSNFDTSGILYWIGTNGLTAPHWTNPMKARAVNVTSTNLAYGKIDGFLSRDPHPGSNHTVNEPDAFFTVDMGMLIVATAYTLRHARGFPDSALRNWNLEGSTDNQHFEILSEHVNDQTLQAPGGTATWRIKTILPYRYFRIKATGNNSGNQQFISCSGFELYGNVQDVIMEEIVEKKVSKKEQADAMTPEEVYRMIPGGAGNNMLAAGIPLARVAHIWLKRKIEPLHNGTIVVKRSIDWCWGDQDGGDLGRGRIEQSAFYGWTIVEWDNGHTNCYRLGYQDKFDVERINSRDPLFTPQQAAQLEAARQLARRHPIIPSQQASMVTPIFHPPPRPLPIGTAPNAVERRMIPPRQVRTDPIEPVLIPYYAPGDPRAPARPSNSSEPAHRLIREHQDNPDDDGLIMYYAPGDPRDPSRPRDHPENRNDVGLNPYSAPDEAMAPPQPRENQENSDSTNHQIPSLNSSESEESEVVQEDPDATIVQRNIDSDTESQEEESEREAGDPEDPEDPDDDPEDSDEDPEDPEDPEDDNDENDDDEKSSAESDSGDSSPENNDDNENQEAPQIAQQPQMLALNPRRDNYLFRRQMMQMARPPQIRESPPGIVILRHDLAPLMPAYDPRAGMNNANQVSEVTLADTKHIETRPKIAFDTKLRLFLTGPNLQDIENVTVELTDDSATFFYYLQKLCNRVEWGKIDKRRMIWEAKYTLSYAHSDHEPLISETKFVEKEIPNEQGTEKCLQLLSVLFKMNDVKINPSAFVSEKLTNKLNEALSDAIVVVGRALPEWCSRLVYEHPYLFPTEIRCQFLQSMAFGMPRAIVSLQNRRDAVASRVRTEATRPEFRVGRLRIDRVTVHRDGDILEQAKRLMHFHGAEKSQLEVAFHGEEGTGLGPTLEFFSLVVAELQTKKLAIWVCDDDDNDDDEGGMEENKKKRTIDWGQGERERGHYVLNKGAGLFPAPFPANSEQLKRAVELFGFMGTLVAKCLLDDRLVNFPLSRPFFQILVDPRFNSAAEPNLKNLLNAQDYEQIDPDGGYYVKTFEEYLVKKRKIETNPTFSEKRKKEELEKHVLIIKGSETSVEQLGLTFRINGSSKIFDFQEVDLIPNGGDVDLTTDNVEQYVELCTDFKMNWGIAQQMRAFRDGFDKVFPITYLRIFTPDELKVIVSGEACPRWTLNHIVQHTEPRLGFTKQSAVFLWFARVLAELDGEQRRMFLQFATGCSSLPPGGLANLHPRLAIVKKEDGDGSYPSVNTCVHYLKLPEYSTIEILRERLLTAINEKGFHLN